MHFGKLPQILVLGFCFFIIGKINLYGQNGSGPAVCSYQIVNEATYSISLMNTALENAQLDPYRFQTQRRTITFQNGAEVILYSALELMNQGCNIDPTVAMPDNQVIDNNRTFDITPDGIIVELVNNTRKGSH